MFVDLGDWSRKFSEEFAKSTAVQFVIRVSFALYICNYAYIRYDYFTARVITDFVPIPVHALTKRLVYTLTFVTVLSYLFHIFFVAPFDNLRRSLNIRVIEKQENDSPSEKGEVNSIADHSNIQTERRG